MDDKKRRLNAQEDEDWGEQPSMDADDDEGPLGPDDEGYVDREDDEEDELHG